jgi:LPXTG-motif cell wall-anchored protein
VKGARAEALPRTGADLVLIALLASVLLGGGLALRRAVERWEPA